MPSRFSVKMRTRRSFHFGGAPGGRFAEGRQVRAQVLADPVDQHADLGVGQVARARRRSPASGRAELCSRRQSASAVCVARRSGLGGVGDGLDLGFFLGLELLGGPARRARRRRPGTLVKRSASALVDSWRRRRPLRCVFSHWRSTVLRWTFRLRANASMDESSRCCSPTTSSPAAAWARFEVLA